MDDGVLERHLLAAAAGGEAAVGAALLAVVAGEELHDPVELGALLGEERRRRDRAGALDRGSKTLLLGEAEADRLHLQESIAESSASRQAESKTGSMVRWRRAVEGWTPAASAAAVESQVWARRAT
jgi:hypothetical protein